MSTSGSRGRLHLRKGRRAFSLVEVVLAMGVVTFCLISLFGLVSVGLNNNRLVREQVVALNLCRQIESDMRATSPTNIVSPLYGIAMPTAGATKTTTLYDCYASSTTSFNTTATSGSQYRFTVTLVGPATGFPNDPVNATIQATWPPQIIPKAPSPSYSPTNVIGTVNLDVAINRFGS